MKINNIKNYLFLCQFAYHFAWVSKNIFELEYMELSGNGVLLRIFGGICQERVTDVHDLNIPR